MAKSKSKIVHLEEVSEAVPGAAEIAVEMTDAETFDISEEPQHSVLELDDSEDISTPLKRAFLGPFSLRETLLAVLAVLILVFSFFPAVPSITSTTIWGSGSQFLLAVLLPLLAVALLLLRRLAPSKITRVGSLGIDQLVSVSFVVAFLSWVAILIPLFEIWALVWPFWVELALMAFGIVLSVLAPFIPGLNDDFRSRALLLARPQSRTVRPLEPRVFAWMTPPADYVRSAEDYTAKTVVVDVEVSETIPGSDVHVSDGSEALSVLWVRADRDVALFDSDLVEQGLLSTGSWALALEESELGVMVKLESGKVLLVKDTDALFWHDREPIFGDAEADER